VWTTSARGVPDVAPQAGDCGWRINLAPGVMFSGVTDQIYGATRDGKIKRGSNRDQVRPVPATLIHVYRRESSDFGWGGRFGVGLAEGALCPLLPRGQCFVWAGHTKCVDGGAQWWIPQGSRRRPERGRSRPNLGHSWLGSSYPDRGPVRLGGICWLELQPQVVDSPPWGHAGGMSGLPRGHRWRNVRACGRK
jgi:hypothetical protein